MSQTMLMLLAALLLGCAGGLVWFTQRAEGRRSRSAGAFVDRRIEAAHAPAFAGGGMPMGAPGSAGNAGNAGNGGNAARNGMPARPGQPGQRSAGLGERIGDIPGVESLALRAGIDAMPKWIGIRAIITPALALVAWLLVNSWMAVFVLGLGVMAAAAELYLKTGRRRKRIVRQLPVFLDLMVRQVTVGTSLNSAFQQIAPKTAQPLGAILERAAQLNRAGIELDAAVKQVARIYGIDQLLMIGSVLGVSTKYGGRSDQVLERISGFMRDTEQARDELVALSAETRLSAWVLGALPLCVAIFLLCFNRGFFLGMWHDPIGMKMLLGAAFLQVFGSLLLYRLAKSV